MQVWIDITGVVCCLWIFVQDLRTRMISLLLFFIMGSLFITDLLLNKNEDLPLVRVNGLFILGQLGFLFFYFKRIRKTDLSFFDGVIGWGDVFMLLCMGMIFPLPQFILYLLLSYLLAMAFSASGKIRGTEVTIPLAGIMGAVYSMNILVYYCFDIYLLQPFEP